MGQCPLMLEGRLVGRVLWQTEGTHVRIRARCPAERGFIYRIELAGAGSALPLGVMAPEAGDGEFSIAKAFPLKAWPFPEGGSLEARILRSRPGEPAGHALVRYRPLEPEFSTSDPLLNDALKRQAGILYTIEGNRLKLAFPLEMGGETSLAPFLALTRYIEAANGGYGLLSFPQAIMVCSSSS